MGPKKLKSNVNLRDKTGSSRNKNIPLSTTKAKAGKDAAEKGDDIEGKAIKEKLDALIKVPHPGISQELESKLQKISPRKKAHSMTSTFRDGEADSPKKEKWEPENWREILENLRKMRSGGTAPVDTMGCDKCADETQDGKTKRYHNLVALMLSSQTKDQVTYEAMRRLKAAVLTPENISQMDVNELENLLKPVSFFRQKAKYLQKTAKILIDQYNSDIPNNVEDLIKLPGVGPKMAHLCMQTAWNQTTGIGVDVHVHRISNRLKWVKKAPTKEPEQTRKELESWLPYENWKEVNHLLVGFGQTICTPINPKCSECLNKDICPFGKSRKTTSK